MTEFEYKKISIGDKVFLSNDYILDEIYAKKIYSIKQGYYIIENKYNTSRSGMCFTLLELEHKVLLNIKLFQTINDIRKQKIDKLMNNE